MKKSQRISALLAIFIITFASLTVASSPAQAYPTGCHVFNPWAKYPLTTMIMTTNRFYAQGCGNSVTDIDLTMIRDGNNVARCAYFRVELFYSDGRSAGAYTINGPWTWLLLCDDTEPHQLLDAVVAGTKYDIQMTPLETWTPVPLWLGLTRD